MSINPDLTPGGNLWFFSESQFIARLRDGIAEVLALIWRLHLGFGMLSRLKSAHAGAPGSKDKLWPNARPVGRLM